MPEPGRRVSGWRRPLVLQLRSVRPHVARVPEPEVTQAGGYQSGGGGYQSGGAAGGSRACFKCGQEGAYMSRECPSGGGGYQSGGAAGGSRACFKCGQEGHMSRECPTGGGGYQSGGAAGGSRACFKCGQEGHMSRECPSQGGAGGARGAVGAGAAPGGNACFKCGQPGHFSRECPTQGGGGYQSGGYQSGGRRDRPSGYGAPAAAGGAPASGSACFRCGQEGHMSRECPTRSANRRSATSVASPVTSARTAPTRRRTETT